MFDSQRATNVETAPLMKLDPFLLLMITAVVIATFFPATGHAAEIVDGLGLIGVSFLFFAHGAALSRQAVLSGLKQWQLHLFIFATTFVVFPIAVLPISFLPTSLVPEDLQLGFLYLAVLPSAVSSSIAYTAIAKGNVPAAVCNSAGSNVFGLLLTPLLMTFFLKSSAVGAADLTHTIKDVVLQLLVPFGLGQAIHPLLGRFIARRKDWLEKYDQSVIVVIIYGAFSQSVTAGLWKIMPARSLVLTVILCTVLLLLIFTFTIICSRRLGFTRGDEIAAVFCGSKKSLASGLPLAQVLFAGNPGFGMIVLPIMLYNQIQILVGAILARKYASGEVYEKPTAENLQ